MNMHLQVFARFAIGNVEYHTRVAVPKRLVRFKAAHPHRCD
jgi:hypothetical protein